MSLLHLLFEPITIGSLRLKNRLVMPPMNDSLAAADGSVTDRQIRYYEERAKGGVGLIITGNAYVEEKKGRISAAQFACFSDRYIPRLSSLADTVHLYDVPILMQLVHGGRQANPNLIEGLPVAPSPLPYPTTGITPQELSIGEIGEIVKQFGKAATRAKQAGFDGVEVHAAHGYLLSGFVSPATNKRSDQYGGSLEKRTRIVVEVIDCVRAMTGSDFVVGVRINGTDGFEGGVTEEISPEVAKILESAGVDYVHVSGGMGHMPYFVQQSNHMKLGCFIPYAAAVKRKVRIPVIAVGSITHPLMAEEVLREGKADLVAMGRSLIVDPQMPMKAKVGDFDDIRTCIRCNVCISQLFKSCELACTLSPEVGREGLYPLTPAVKPSKIMVIGGGPAGLETARSAALRGYQVALYEASGKLGGVSIPEDNPAFKKELENIPRYYSSQFKKLDVEVRLKERVTIETVERVKPDAVVIATGGSMVMPEVPGIDNPKVVPVLDTLNGKVGVGPRMLVVGAGLVGCETALHLTSKGKKVTLVTRRKKGDVAADVSMVNRKALLEELQKADIPIIENCELRSVDAGGAVFEDREGKKVRIEADQVIIARGFKPQLDLYDQLVEKGMKVFAVGDCVKPGDIRSAIRDAYHLARRL